MTLSRTMRNVCLLATGAMMLQFTGCTFTDFNDFVQTVFLGVTAAGAVAILKNI